MMRSRTRPPFAVTYKGDSRGRDVRYYREGMSRHTLAEKLTNIHHLFRSKLASWRSFAPQVHETGLPLMPGVTRARNPLKILRPIIGLDPVDVVNGKALCVSRNEGPPYQAVHSFFNTYPALLRCYLKIAASSLIGGKASPPELAGEGLPLPSSSPCVRGCVGRRFDRSIGVNHPLASFRYYDHLSHVCSPHVSVIA